MNFVIYGEDKLLMEQRLKTLKKKYHIQEDDMNIVTYWCQDTPLSSIIEDALTPPFLSEYKMIVVKNPVFLTTQKQKIASDEDIQKLADTFEEFQNGTLEDIKGFCATCDIQDIAKQDYILTPGRYVGIEEQEDDGEPFEEKMTRLTSELSDMFTKSHELEEEIRKKLGAIGYEV